MAVSETVLTEYLATVPAAMQKKGREIFENQPDDADDLSDQSIELNSEGPRSVEYLVPSQTDDYDYQVRLSWTANKLSARCDCLSYQDYGKCKHIVAAILQLRATRDMIGRNDVIEEAVIVSEANASPAALPAVTSPERFVKKSFSVTPVNAFRTIDWNIGYRQSVGEIRKIRDMQLDTEGSDAVWTFTYRQSAKEEYFPQIVYDKQTSFRLSCTCSALLHVCDHLHAAASYLHYQYGGGYFVQFRDYSKDREAALRKLGISPDDPEAAAITLTVDAWGNASLKLPDWLLQPAQLKSRIDGMIDGLGLQAPENPDRDFQRQSAAAALQPGFLLLHKSTALPFHFELQVLNVKGTKFVKINLDNADRIDELRLVLPPEIFSAVEGLAHSRLNRALDQMGANWKIPNQAVYIRPGERSYNYLYTQYADALETLWPHLSSPGTEVYEAENQPASRKTSARANLSKTRLTAHLTVRKSGNFIELRPAFRDAATGEAVEDAVAIVGNGLLLRTTASWYLPADDATRNLLQQLPAGFLKIPAADSAAVMKTLLPALRSRYEVDLDPALEPVVVRQTPEPYLQLSEQGKYLLLVPRFRYGKDDIGFQAAPQPVVQQGPGDTWIALHRDTEAERRFAETIRDLHPSFAGEQSLRSFSLSFPLALQNSWYQKTLALLAERGVEVRGIRELEHFRYNINEAKVSVSSKEGGSGIDWFDVLIEISFGDQQVSLKEVRKALMNGQAGVRLGDGSIGLLPDEFIAQYGALLKLGKEKADGGLRLNKLHFTLVDTLHDAALSRDLKADIAAKKAALEGVERIKVADVPPAVQATLRPYQLAGFQWLQTLDKLGWGGCLADDMGLGKTLQTITFLQHLKDTNPQGTQLVVCPTSLIYNWQAELEKFAPGLRYHIHYGPGRVWNPAITDETDIVITTYGLVRSDLETLSTVNWHYVILDESQAIKNPEAQTTRAVQALRAKNRLCLSGTPLQNNTYDLYAQFEFLNPGLLGSREFFRTEFATPIDKQGSETARATLRRMLAPFMLRRKKEQVAKDLPDKTEVTLWCEMESEQRAVYNEYRRYYRDSLLKRIDDEGMQGSSIYILEALLRMRQLCDHPQLVKNEAVTTNASIKLDELRREISENAGGRKVLVFSQFTEMLALIRESFEADGIRYAYLDGQTPAAKRKQAVEKFQNDPQLQVFLISLKAGGVGLNLTAAEYVYIVDPWWNPAVEAQAIDRTHRIGQQAKIVAYRMICKDTVEEKVMLLQSRKKALAEGLVTEDAGFVKKLTREDVAFLLE